MITRIVILITSLLPAIALFSGCDERSGGANHGSEEPLVSGVPEDYPKFARAWVGANGLEHSQECEFDLIQPENLNASRRTLHGMEQRSSEGFLCDAVGCRTVAKICLMVRRVQLPRRFFGRLGATRSADRRRDESFREAVAPIAQNGRSSRTVANLCNE